MSDKGHYPTRTEPRYTLRHCGWCAGRGGWQTGSCPEGSDIDYRECDRCGMLGVQILMGGKWINPLDWLDVMRDAIPRMLQAWPAPGYRRAEFDAGHRAMHAVDVIGEAATPDEMRDASVAALEAYRAEQGVSDAPA